MQTILKRVLLSMTLVFSLCAYGDSVIIGDLMWQDEVYTNSEQESYDKNNKYKKIQDWQGAKDYCMNLNYAGYSDWTLPSKSQLLSLYENKIQLKNNMSYYYWVSDEYDSSSAWFMSFGDGGTYYNFKSFVYSVRCVRSKPAEKAKNALSPEIRFDMLKEKLTQELKANAYTQALSTMSEIRSLGIKVPKSFIYFEGKALFESGKKAESYSKFEKYVVDNGKKGKFYNQSIAYLIKADEAKKEREAAKVREKEERKQAKKDLCHKYRKKFDRATRMYEEGGCNGNGNCEYNNMEAQYKYRMLLVNECGIFTPL